MPIEIEGIQENQKLKSNSNDLAEFVDQLTRAYRDHGEYIAELHQCMLFNDHPLLTLEVLRENCDFCNLLTNIEDKEITEHHVYQRLKKKHKVIHSLADQLVILARDNRLQPHEYDIFKRFCQKEAYYVDQLKQLGTFSIAHVDDLTSLLTRDVMEEMIEKEWSRSQRNGSPFCVAMIDIDHFKKVNDTYGHPAGDQVLREIASIIDDNLRPYDEVFRYGGEEFLVLLPDTQLSKAVPVLTRVHEAINVLTIQTEEAQIKATSSIGIASSVSHNTYTDVIEASDKLLYGAKEAGRNKILHEKLCFEIELNTP
ncbi:GGDEF domain-containing protein [Terasakiella sp. A23]|uniref:GGDEF domain-containing protein n=1 Tax=Terasakiella sp. FCG-A23 TaxID=3080561 RepID=UPI002955A0D4|nr:GGDEF domain-containing protein [Terasakiella sp. A23]MDV7340926.1 GGDEF domain-containing protein [Terasakiella sp. A23]